MSYLLLFTIGPVQSLIGNSRKTYDMYAGSKLLSGLMRDAVHILEKNPDVKLLFPVDTGQSEEDSDMPNRLIAEFTTADREAHVRYARELERKVKENFLDTCIGYLEAYVGEKGVKAAKRQLKDFLEVYWILEPYDGEDYQRTYNRLFERIQVIKSIRAFSQTTEPSNRKCMLFPEYNAIFIRRKREEDGSALPYNTNKDDICDLTDVAKLRYQVKPGEALSAIGLVKRLYKGGSGGKIHSLRLMLLKSRGKLSDQGAGQGDMLANAVYDIANGKEPDYSEYDEFHWHKAEVEWEKLRKDGIKLASYYALVKFDGDNMGDVFCNCSTPEKQTDLSRSISEFASWTPGIIVSYGGLPVYAGGEDFLGFLPLDKLFVCLEKLHQCFREKVGLTFSAGVAVAHLMQPLKEVAIAAEDMERCAKKTDKNSTKDKVERNALSTIEFKSTKADMGYKNAIVIGILKRSGENVITPPLKFDAGTGQPSLCDFQELVRELNSSGCSKTLLYHLGDQFNCFFEEGAVPEPALAEILIQRAVSATAAANPGELVRRLMVFYRKEGPGGFMKVLNAASFISGEVIECSM